MLVDKSCVSPTLFLVRGSSFGLVVEFPNVFAPPPGDTPEGVSSGLPVGGRLAYVGGTPRRKHVHQVGIRGGGTHNRRDLKSKKSDEVRVSVFMEGPGGAAQEFLPFGPEAGHQFLSHHFSRSTIQGQEPKVKYG